MTVDSADDTRMCVRVFFPWKLQSNANVSSQKFTLAHAHETLITRVARGVSSHHNTQMLLLTAPSYEDGSARRRRRRRRHSEYHLHAFSTFLCQLQPLRWTVCKPGLGLLLIIT